MKITTYENNAKEHTKEQLEKIANSIKEFGCLQPIVVNEDGVILAGHGRYLAMTNILGYTEEKEKSIALRGETFIPFIVSKGLTEAQQRAYRIADNKINQMTSDNIDIVIQEMKFINLNGLDAEITGYSNDLLVDSKDDDDTEGTGAYLKYDTTCELGDIIEINGHRICWGDATNKETISRLMNGQKADMVWTDPPYNVNVSGLGKETKRNIIGDKLDGDEFYKLIFESMKLANEFSKDSSSFYIWHNYKWQDVFGLAIKNAGIRITQQIVWNKPNAGLSAGDYRPKHELAFYGDKGVGKAKWYGNRDKSSVWDFNKDTKEEDLVRWAKRIIRLESEGKTSIWSIGRDNVMEYIHPTQKPVDLVKVGLRNSSERGDIVLDLFLGSGSTAICCENYNRFCYGTELDQEFFSKILWRIYQKLEANKKPIYILKNNEEIQWEKLWTIKE